MHRTCFGKWALVVVTLALAGESRAGDEKSAAQVLPASTVAFLHLQHVDRMIEFVVDSPMKEAVEESADFRKAMETPNAKQFKAVVGLLEQRVGATWRQTLESMTRNGIDAAYDADTRGVVILAGAGDMKKADALREVFLGLARDDAKMHNLPEPVEQIDYRGLRAYKVNEAVIVDVGPWVMLCNNLALARSVADRCLDGGASLADDHAFADASAHRPAADESGAWAFVRLQPLREHAVDQPLLDPKYKSSNPGLEFLLGGLLPIVRQAECASAALVVKDRAVHFSISAPVGLAALTEAKKFFFAAPGDGAAPPLRPDKTMLSLSMYRDASVFWQAAPDLFTESVATQMAQADSGLSTFFGGKSYGVDVLGAFKPQLQLIAATQEHQDPGAVPTTRLPAFALVMPVRPEQFTGIRKHMRVGFQSIIAFANIDGAGKGRPTLELQSEKHGGCEIQFATYDLTDKPAARDDTYLNFTPALVISQRYMMLCTTRQIAEQMADVVDKGANDAATIEKAKGGASDNTLLQIDGAAVADLITQDREPLIAKNMLEKGQDRATAEREINVLAKLAASVRDLRVRLTPSDHAVELAVDVQTAPPAAPK